MPMRYQINNFGKEKRKCIMGDNTMGGKDSENCMTTKFPKISILPSHLLNICQKSTL